MPVVDSHAQLVDPVWTAIRAEAWSEEEREPFLRAYLKEAILKRRRLEEALGQLLTSKLATSCITPELMQSVIDQAFAASQATRAAIRRDLLAINDRDPAARGFLTPFLFFKGFHALASYRVAHWLWSEGRQFLAVHFQNRISEVFAVDIHPAAKLGSGIFIDHGTGVVIGETSVIDDDVSLLHEVTLGGTGKESGDRHPKVRRGVLIGAGAKVLGNVVIGEGAKIGAGSVVLDSVPPHSTVAGVPAKLVGRCAVDAPALEMDQQFPHDHAEGGGI
jgi:serine O-acetyltransferase